MRLVGCSTVAFFFFLFSFSLVFFPPFLLEDGFLRLFFPFLLLICSRLFYSIPLGNGMKGKGRE